MTTAAAPVIAWRPHRGPQTRFLSSSADEALYGGAAGGGKSDALLVDGLRDIDHPASRVLFLRRTFPELREMMDRALTLFPRFGATWNEQRKRWTFPSGATYEFGYCETYADALRYQGQQFTRLKWDEIGQIAEERTWDFLLSRLRSTQGVSIAARCSANPGGKGHAWLKARFIDPMGLAGGRWSVSVTLPDGTTTTRSRAYVPARLRDNPSLGPDYLATLAALPERMRRQLLDGDWDAGEGLFFPESGFTLAPALAYDLLPDWWRYWGAYDWGFRHPAAAMAFAQDGDGTVYVVDSWHRRALSDVEQAQSLAAFFPAPCKRNILAGADAFNKRRAHEETPETVADVFGRHGLNLAPATTDREAGWKALLRLMTPERTAFGVEPRARLVWCDTPGNRAAIARIRTLTVSEDNPNDVEKLDATETNGWLGDDSADALRYGCASIGGRKAKRQPLPWQHAEQFTPGMDETDPAELARATPTPRRVRPRSRLEAAVAGVPDDAQFPEGW